MKAQALIDMLYTMHPSLDVFILDGSNAGGHPREINVNCLKTITQEDIDHSADVEDRPVGLHYLAIGYGCY